MDSPLSPVITDFYMEAFELSALQSALLKSSFYHRYVDDTFLTWPHGLCKLQEVVSFLNGCHESIPFIVEIKHNRHQPFGDVLVYTRKAYCAGGRMCVDRKLIHTNLYLNKRSHNCHPTQKCSIFCTLTYRARAIANQEHLGEEKLLESIFHPNGHHDREMAKVLSKSGKGKLDKDEEMEGINWVVVIPFCDTVSSRIKRLLKRANITMVFCSPIEDRAVDEPCKRLLRVGYARCISHTVFLWPIYNARG